MATHNQYKGLVNQAALFDTRPQHPGRMLRQLMEEKGWTQDDLAAIIGKSRQSISEIVSGKNGITLDMAMMLAAAFENSAQEWLKWDQMYRLSMADRDVTEVQRMAQLYGKAPVRDMIKRGWIRPPADALELRAEMEAFFGPEALEDGLSFPVATKRTVKLPYLNTAEITWCFRARQLASGLLANPFSDAGFAKAQGTLRRLAAHPKEARHLPKVLADAGIRFVVIEPLPEVRIDGAAFWDDRGPVIAVSLRHDRIDGFWFTVMHECAHIRNGDTLSVDTGLVDGTKGITVSLVEDVAEERANREAAASLIQPEELESFIRRVGPFYPRDRVIQFANRLKIHPGVIVGQLQHRKELGYMALRDLLVKVRDHVVATALTDGWGQMIAPSVLGDKI
jgi:HTH-type transcriptional regulator/antitoxin HigA